jgi:outer membrane lipoprotein-sorting protein
MTQSQNELRVSEKRTMMVYRCMAAVLLLCGLYAFGYAAPAAAAGNPVVDPKAHELLTRMADAYRALQSCSMQVEIRTETGGQADVIKGTITFKRPNQALVETTSARGKAKAVADGKFIYIVQSQNPKEYAKVATPANNGTISRTIEAAGAGGNGLFPFVVAGYDPYAVVSRNLKSLTILAPDMIDSVRVDVVQVVTEAPNLGDATMTVAIGRSDHLLRRVGILAENNGVAIIETLSGVKSNPTFPDSLFQFTPPAGSKQVTLEQPTLTHS